MSDRTAFYQAIWAAPDDDLPRLVFADWLDEHDDPDAAAFLRLLCACRTCPPDVDQLRPLVAQLRRTMVKLPPEFIENACPVPPAVVIGPWVDVDHTANRGVLKFIQLIRRERTGLRPIGEWLPGRSSQANSVRMEREGDPTWERLRAVVPSVAACTIDGVAALVDVWSGVVVALTDDTNRRPLRGPTDVVFAVTSQTWFDWDSEVRTNLVRLWDTLGRNWREDMGPDLIDANPQRWQLLVQTVEQTLSEFDPAHHPLPAFVTASAGEDDRADRR